MNLSVEKKKENMEFGNKKTNRRTENKRRFGSLGEKLAEEYLAKEGYKILHRNFHVSRLGELDMIAEHGEYICFIEVKTRTSTLFGTPGEAVDARKQANIRTLAWAYLKQFGLTERKVRFDVVEVTGRKAPDGFAVQKIQLIQNAF